MDAILRKRLKTWQKEFRQKNGGREPKRSDIAKVPEIASIYETWTALNAAAHSNGQGESQPQQAKAKGKQREISRSTSHHKTSSSQDLPMRASESGSWSARSLNRQDLIFQCCITSLSSHASFL